MKKVLVALTLMMFAGSMTATVYAATTGTKTEIRHDDKKKKKADKKKKGAACSKGSTCCQKKAA